ncbi:MAG TPA: hypothetical protein VMY35_06000 [Phycisphaerae bacterium]|nr:hypothetical protein [Phycisphaerae bacterium]
MNRGNVANLEAHAAEVVAAYRRGVPMRTLMLTWGVAWHPLDRLFRRHMTSDERREAGGRIKANAARKRTGKPHHRQGPLHRRSEVEANKRQLRKELRGRELWQCPACAYELAARPRKGWRCPKCGGFAVERIEVPTKAA